LDALEEFKLLLAMMENVQGTTLKEIVSDRGGEFVDQAFKDFTSTCGIVHVLSPPYTPQYNGFTERANQTIIEKARCILMSISLPRLYWAEAVSTSVFISNLLPTLSQENLSPYELWAGASPPVSQLQTFGCLAYIVVQKPIGRGSLATLGSGVFLLGTRMTAPPIASSACWMARWSQPATLGSVSWSSLVSLLLLPTLGILFLLMMSFIIVFWNNPPFPCRLPLFHLPCRSCSGCWRCRSSF
jgi:hypothetical protein